MGPPLFSELPKTANDLFTKENKDFGGRVEISSKLKNGVDYTFNFARAEDDGALSSQIVLKKTLANVDCTALLSSASESSITLEHKSLFPNLTLRLERPITPSATLVPKPAVEPAAGADKKPADKKPAPADAAKAPAAADAAKAEAPSSALAGPTVTAEYKTADYAASAAINLAKQEANLSFVFQHSGILLGAATDYSLAEGAFGARRFRAYRAPAQDGGLELSAYIEGSEAFGASAYRSVAPDLSVGAGVDVSGSGGVAVLLGAEKTVGKASLRADANLGSGLLSAVFSQTVRPDTTFQATARLNTYNLTDTNAHKVGLSILLGI